MYGINTLPYYTSTSLRTSPNYVGGGSLDIYGRQQYGLGKLVKSITRPIAKVLDKIVPNEIKPALPFLAAATPFLAPGLISGIGGLFTANPALAGAIGSGVLNVGAQAAQEGFDKRGLNLGSLGLAALGGAIANPGAADYFGGSQIVGSAPMTAINPELAQFGNLATQNVPITAANVMTGVGLPTSTDLSALDKLQNIATSSAQKAAEFIERGRTGLETEGILSTDFLKAAAPGQIGAVADKAYAAAQDAKIKYDEQMAQAGQTVAKSKADQIAYIRSAMQSAGFNDDEISSAITRSGFADGGEVDEDITLSPIQREMANLQLRMYDQQKAQENTIRQREESIKQNQESMMRRAGFKEEDIQRYLSTSNYADGGSSSKPQPMPVNPELLALAIFGKRLDELTSTQKNALSDYVDLPKKAKGGIMDLGGKEMDLRASGGFIPIGKKERADDVPARLSKNEFVFTAKAVRNAGGGDIRKGAKRMYQIMNQLEARA